MERLIGRDLPAGLRAAYLEHNGQTNAPLFVGLHLLPVHVMSETYKQQLEHLRGWPSEDNDVFECIGPIKQLFWSPHWIPFAEVGGQSTYLCFDFDPEPGGVAGQVVWVHKETEREVLFDGLAELLAAMTASLRKYPELDAGQLNVEEVIRFG